MGVSLSKGGNVSLTKEAPGLKAIMVGLGWDAKTEGVSGEEFDLDAVLFMCGEDGKVTKDEDFVFYNNPKSVDGSVVHQGDNRTGEGEGDDEKVLINLADVPANITKLAVAVTIDKADERGQNFGQVSNAFMRVVNVDGDVELARFDLGEDFSTETAVIFGEIYRNGADWKFKAIGQGFPGGLSPLATAFGVDM